MRGHRCQAGIETWRQRVDKVLMEFGELRPLERGVFSSVFQDDGYTPRSCALYTLYIYIYEYASYYILSIDNVYMQNMYNSHLWPRSPFSGSNPTANRKRSVEQQLWKGLDRRKLEIHQTLTQLTGSFLIFET